MARHQQHARRGVEADNTQVAAGRQYGQLAAGQRLAGDFSVLAVEYVGKSRVAVRQRNGDRRARLHGDIQVDRLGDHFGHGTGHAIELAGNHLHFDAVDRTHHRDVLGADVLVARRNHLVLGRQVHPQLEAPHQAVFLLGHFRMEDAAAGGHPLHAARHQVATVAVVVVMLHMAGEHVGHGFETAMRMLGETRDVVARLIGTKFVQQQEGIEHVQARLADDALELDARTVRGVDAADAAKNAALSHGLLPWIGLPSMMPSPRAMPKRRNGNGLFRLKRETITFPALHQCTQCPLR